MFFISFSCLTTARGFKYNFHLMSDMLSQAVKTNLPHWALHWLCFGAQDGELYCESLKYFLIASDNGLICFHLHLQTTTLQKNVLG